MKDIFEQNVKASTDSAQNTTAEDKPFVGIRTDEEIKRIRIEREEKRARDIARRHPVFLPGNGGFDF